MALDISRDNINTIDCQKQRPKYQSYQQLAGQNIGRQQKQQQQNIQQQERQYYCR